MWILFQGLGLNTDGRTEDIRKDYDLRLKPFKARAVASDFVWIKPQPRSLPLSYQKISSNCLILDLD
jgi:hypothetical protein